MSGAEKHSEEINSEMTSTYIGNKWNNELDRKEYGTVLESIYKKSNDNLRMFSNTISLVSSATIGMQLYLLSAAIGFTKVSNINTNHKLFGLTITIVLFLFLDKFIKLVSEISAGDREVIFKIDNLRGVFDKTYGVYNGLNESYKNFASEQFQDDISRIWVNTNFAATLVISLTLTIICAINTCKNTNKGIIEFIKTGDLTAILWIINAALILLSFAKFALYKMKKK